MCVLEQVNANVFSRLDEPGVREIVLNQYNSAPPEQHNPVSNDFLAEGSELRAMVLAMNPDGTNMHPRLKEECDSIALIPLNGTPAEEPHARATRIGQSTRASRWPWVASTMRLTQNLDDVKQIPKSIDVNMQRLWNNWKSLIQMRPKFAKRNKRVSDKVFTNTVYAISSGDIKPDKDSV